MSACCTAIKLTCIGRAVSDTPRTDAPTSDTEFIASWNDWEGAVCCKLEDYERLERELAAERKRADEAERDAKRWKQALMFIGADVDRSGEQCFVIRMPLFRQVNLMRGSVSEHFTKRIDEAMRNG